MIATYQFVLDQWINHSIRHGLNDEDIALIQQLSIDAAIIDQRLTDSFQQLLEQ